MPCPPERQYMQSKATISQVEGDAALYALGALSARDAESFRQRLAAGCHLCRGLLEECRGVVEMLPLAAPELEPPAGLRSRLMSRIGADSRPGAVSGVGDGHLVRANDTAWQDG